MISMLSMPVLTSDHTQTSLVIQVGIGEMEVTMVFSIIKFDSHCVVSILVDCPYKSYKVQTYICQMKAFRIYNAITHISTFDCLAMVCCQAEMIGEVLVASSGRWLFACFQIRQLPPNVYYLSFRIRWFRLRTQRHHRR